MTSLPSRGAVLLFAALALAGAACLDPGAPLLAPIDEAAPTVLRSRPAPAPDGGLGELPRGTDLEVVFSEQMDPATLPPAFRLRSGDVDQPLRLAVPSLGRPSASDADVPFAVQASPIAGPLALGATYELVLSTRLADAQGNALAAEVRVPFRVVP